MKNNNSIYLYDDHFISLLNLIWLLEENKIKPMNIKPYYYEPSLFDEIIKLKVEIDENIIRKIIAKTNYMLFKLILEVYLSEMDNREIIIYYFYLNCLKYGNKVIYMRKLKCVCKTLEISQKVSREAHRLKGFLRFKELKNGVLYGEMSPSYYILPLLIEHFKKRLSNEYFIIHDVKRKILCLYDKHQSYIVKESELKIDFCEKKEEIEISKLWKSFYQTIGIELRNNPRCRMNFMPKKYWPYMLEMEKEYEKSC